jgi:hypothetical protein
VDDALLADIHGLIEQVGRGNAETLLEVLRRIVAAEAVAVELREQLAKEKERREMERAQDRADRAASEAQFRSAVVELRQFLWIVVAILAVIVLILLVATIAQMVRGR